MMILGPLIAFTAARVQAADQARTLAPGDTIEIRCDTSAAYCVRRTLEPNGAITLPDVPDVKLEGLTTEEAASWLGRLLDRTGVAANPHLRVRQIEGRTLTVSIGGMVAHPETRFLSPGMTLQELITEASPQTGSDPNRVLVTSVDGVTRTVDPAAVAWPLRPGDRVELVIRAAHPEVFIIGGVEAPGAIPFESGMTVYQAVHRVGGVSALGSQGGWRVAHAGTSYVNLGDGPDATGFKLSAGDTVEVPTTEAMTAYSVIGAVVQPSRVDYRKGTRLSAVLKAAGGLRPDAAAARIAIRSPDGTVAAGLGDPVLKPGAWVIVPSSG